MLRRYVAEFDNYETPVVAANPYNKRDVARLPSPMPSRYVWRPHFQQLRQLVGSVVSDDGKTSTRRLKDVVQDLLCDDKPLMLSRTGASAEHPVEINVLLDGLPLQSFSVAHFCIANASRTDRSTWMSESELRCIAITTLSDNNKGQNAVFREEHFAEDLNNIKRAGGIEDNSGKFVHVQFTGCMDKKAVEAFEGTGPCSPWCICPRANQHLMPWAHDAPRPRTWAEYLRLARVVCKGCVSRDVTLELSHAVAGKFCRGCGKVPYRDEAARLAAKSALMAMATSTDKGIMKEYKKKRADYSVLHFYRHEFTEHELELAMDEIVPELMHLDSLNVAKLLMKWLLLRHADVSCRERLSIFFAGMGVPIDLRKKGDGRVKGDKWWRASVWDSLVKGSDARPGGIAAWLPTVVFIVLNSHVQSRAAGCRTDEANMHKPADAAETSM